MFFVFFLSFLFSHSALCATHTAKHHKKNIDTLVEKFALSDVDSCEPILNWLYTNYMLSDALSQKNYCSRLFSAYAIQIRLDDLAQKSQQNYAVVIPVIEQLAKLTPLVEQLTQNQQQCCELITSYFQEEPVLKELEASLQQSIYASVAEEKQPVEQACDAYKQALIKGIEQLFLLSQSLSPETKSTVPAEYELFATIGNTSQIAQVVLGETAALFEGTEEALFFLDYLLQKTMLSVAHYYEEFFKVAQTDGQRAPRFICNIGDKKVGETLPTVLKISTE